MPVITPSAPSSSTAAATPTANGSTATARQGDFARVMGQASDRSGATSSQCQSSDASHRPAASHQAHAAARDTKSEPSSPSAPAQRAGADERAASEAKPAEDQDSGKTLPHGQDKAKSKAQTEGDKLVAPGVDGNWQAQMPTVPQEHTAVDEEAASVAEDATASEADPVAEPVSQEGSAGRWRGDGADWLVHLQASREQPTSLAADQTRVQDTEGEAADGATKAAAMTTDKAAHLHALAKADAAGQPLAESPLFGGDATAGDIDGKTRQGPALSAESDPAALEVSQQEDRPAAKERTAPATPQTQPMDQAPMAPLGGVSAAQAQQDGLKGVYLNGLSRGEATGDGAKPVKSAGLGKVVNAATHQAGQPAGALVGQDGVESESIKASDQHRMAEGSERMLEPLNHRQEGASLGSQASQSASVAGESQAGVSPASAAHGSPAHMTSLAQTASLADKADRLQANLPSLSNLPMTTNLNENAEQLGQRLTLMIGQKWHEAELQLEPEGLGKMRIQLKMDQEQQAQVHILVQHSQTKELVDQALPRLRDMLAGQGIQMSQAQVQQHSAGQQGAGAQGGQWGSEGQAGQGGHAQGPNAPDGEEQVTQRLAIHSTGSSGIDFYA